MRFDDGTQLPADVIIVATGYVQQLLLGFFRIPDPLLLATSFDNGGVAVRRLLGEDKAAGIPPGWGLNPEGELRAMWREMPSVPNFWLLLGTLTDIVSDIRGAN